MLILLLVLFVIVRFTYLRAPGADLEASVSTTLGQVVDALIGAMLAALGVAILLIVVFPGPDMSEAVRVLPSREIGSFIRSEVADTREWLIRARTGVYFRARTIRWLGELATANHRAIRVQLVIMDPRDTDLARRLLLTRAQVAGGAWDEKRVMHEICASILTCVGQARRHPRLDISIALSRNLWIISLDISSRYVLVAGPQNGHPAIAYSANSEFFDSFRSEFEATYGGAEKIDFSGVQNVDFTDTGNISAALAAMGLSASVTEPADLEEIRQLIQNPERSNQYR
ncbi:hypothetical protein [Pseudonocardia lacus]|uniref:hypothetical protein n=1 Tax=Pseudonocardia lacus TaxID=2835865 RepID=UPI001BDDB0AC|nr:hypothetical protein [Pseudonocardia lacus]